MARSAFGQVSLLKSSGWFCSPAPSDVRDFPGVQLAWAKRQGNQPHPFVCVQVPGGHAAPGAALTADFWIYAP